MVLFVLLMAVGALLILGGMLGAQTFGGFALNDPLVANFRNLIDGGDFTVNPWQRNVAGIQASANTSATISNTVTYFPDRFFAVGGASSSITLSKVADTSIAGFGNSLKFQRTAANTNTAALNLGQVMETADAIRCQGQQVTLSFWAKTGANYSGGALTVQLFTGTGTNDTAANMVAAAWAGNATPINTTQALTSTMTRYTFTSTAIGATATQMGVLLTFTPTGTAGADDSITINGVQLEIGQAATPFEHRDAQVELEICQRYAWIQAEPASGVVVGSGTSTGTNAQTFYIALPVQMYKAPTLTVSAGTFKVALAAGFVAGAGIAAGTTHTPNAISLVGTVTATAGFGALLGGGGGTGYIIASADF